MTRVWKMKSWNGNRYVSSGAKHRADGPVKAVRAFGFDPLRFDCRASRVGYGYYAGNVYIRLPETLAAGGPADFVLYVDET